MSFYKVRLELGRTKQFPDGSNARGYEFVAPITNDSHLDEDAWRQNRARCVVRRFWQGEDDEHGMLVHTRHRTWAFSYAPGEEDDEPVYKLDSHVFKTGEYISIKEQEGDTLPFRIVTISPLD